MDAGGTSQSLGKYRTGKSRSSAKTLQKQTIAINAAAYKNKRKGRTLYEPITSTREQHQTGGEDAPSTLSPEHSAQPRCGRADSRQLRAGTEPPRPHPHLGAPGGRCVTRVHHLTSISGRQRGTTLSLFFVREGRKARQTDLPTGNYTEALLRAAPARRSPGRQPPAGSGALGGGSVWQRAAAPPGSRPAWRRCHTRPPPTAARVMADDLKAPRLPAERGCLPPCLPPRGPGPPAAASTLLPTRACRGVSVERVVGAANNSADRFGKEPREIKGK